MAVSETDLFESNSTSSSLLDRVRSRDPAAWRRFVELYSPLVYTWCRWTRLPEQDAADVTQDVFQAVVQGIDRFRKVQPGDSFRGWLYTITRNAVSDHMARLAKSPRAGGGSSQAAAWRQLPHEPSAASELDAAQAGLYQRALALSQTEFEERTWRAVLALIEGRPAAEIARELGMSPAAVRNAKYKVLRRLRDELGDDDPPPPKQV
jgi:RNA polymerase sigma-70 factor (ECF subfamily)